MCTDQSISFADKRDPYQQGASVPYLGKADITTLLVSQATRHRCLSRRSL